MELPNPEDFEHPHEKSEMRPAEPESKSLSEDLFGVSAYEAAAPQKKVFLPWHKPRKQFVRHKQWCVQIKQLIEESMPENKVLRYLGLPGDDLLDLRHFHKEVCLPNDIKLKYLGFNNSAESKSPQNAELNISIDELNKLPNIDPSSNVIPDDVCNIADRKSVAWNYSLNMGPFEVVNVDLCDGFAKEPPTKFLNSHYSALSQLLTLQAKQKKPWLLFLTTRTRLQDIDEDVLGRLMSLYEENLQNCTTFLDKSKEHFSISDKGSLTASISTQKGVSDVFLISLCKWISGMLVKQNPPSKVELKSAIGYKVEHGIKHPDLVSIVLKISPNYTAANDNLGLTKNNEPALNECDIATQILNRIFKQVDADSVLNDDAKVLEEMISMSINLLEEARYDISGYRDWIDSAGTKQ